AALLQDVSNHRSGGRFAVRASDADDRTLQIPRGEFHLADNFDTAGTGFTQLRRIHGHAWRKHDEIDIAKAFRSLRHNLDAIALQLARVCAELVRRTLVHCLDASPFAQKKLSGGDS